MKQIPVQKPDKYSYRCRTMSLDNLHSRTKTTQRTCNVDKTCYSVFGPNCKKDLALNLHINGKAIQNVTCCKYLGIMIDSDLKWKHELIRR